MRCYYCKAPNPPGRTMCQSCGLPVTPLSGEEAVGAFMTDVIQHFNPLTFMMDKGIDLFLRHKANQTLENLKKSIRAFDEGKYDEVRHFAQKADIKDNYPPDIRALNHLLLGTAFLNLEDFPKARSHFTQLLALSGSTDKSLVPEAVIYRVLGNAIYQEWVRSGAAPNARLNEAIQAYDNGIQRDPRNHIARRHRAQALAQAQRYYEALDDLDVALQHPTKIAGVYAYRALVNIQLGDLLAGRADAQKALNIDPNNGPAIAALQASFAAG